MCNALYLGYQKVCGVVIYAMVKNHDDEMKKIASKIYRYVHEEFSQGNTDVVYNQCRMEAECDTQATLGVTRGGWYVEDTFL